MNYDILYTTYSSSVVKHFRVFADNRAQALSYLHEKRPHTDCVISVTPTPNDLL